MLFTFEVERIRTMADRSVDVTLTLPEGAHAETDYFVRRLNEIIVLEDVTEEVAEQARDDGWKTD